MSEDSNRQETEKLLADLMDEVGQKRIDTFEATGMRLALEARQKAQAERFLIPYLDANFEIMNLAQHQFEPEMESDAAVRCIALLESPDQARTFQPDFPDDHYQWKVFSLSSCSYDNLAIATAVMSGYNSPGMQSCIADGIGVCQRTGKTECITCFREYASDVFRAADDLPMALSHVRANLAKKPARIGTDRRWTSACTEAELLMLQGSLTAALQAAKNAATLIDTYWSKPWAIQRTRSMLGTIYLMTGVKSETDTLVPEETKLPRGENLEKDHRDDLNAAIAASVGSDHATAIEKLTHWDDFFTKKKCLSWWFETRVRLIATHLLAGNRKRAEALAKQLKQAALGANDYLTLRRLQLLMSGEISASPVPA